MPPRPRSESPETPEITEAPGKSEVPDQTTPAARQPEMPDQLEAGAGITTPDNRAAVALRIPLPTALLPGNVDAKRLLWFGSLGALAVAGILEWPVALVVGAGSVVAERFARQPTDPATRSPITERPLAE